MLGRIREEGSRQAWFSTVLFYLVTQWSLLKMSQFYKPLGFRCMWNFSSRSFITGLRSPPKLGGCLKFLMRILDTPAVISRRKRASGIMLSLIFLFADYLYLSELMHLWSPPGLVIASCFLILSEVMSDQQVDILAKWLGSMLMRWIKCLIPVSL